MTEVNEKTVQKYVLEYCRVKRIKYIEQVTFPAYSSWICEMHKVYKEKIGKNEMYSPSLLSKEGEEYYKGFCEFLENISQQEEE